MLSSEGAPKIVVVGVGVIGCKILRMLSGVRKITIGTDERCLLATRADRKVLIDSRREVAEVFEDLTDKDIVFVCAGMDVGVEKISAVAKIAKERGATVVGIIRVLFVERTKIEEIRKHANTVIVLDSSRLLERADQIVAEAIKRLAEEITVDSINFADIRDVLRRGGIAVMFFGEGKGEDIVKNCLSHPSFDVDYNGNNQALIFISGGPNLTIREAEDIVADLSSKMNISEAIWSAKIEKELRDNVKVIAIVIDVRL